MRVGKDGPSGSTRTRYDGQMAMEDLEASAPDGDGNRTVTALTRYGLGARGVDMIERVSLPPGGGQGGGTTVTAFPIYDAHGNNVASLTRNGSGFSLGNRRA